MTRFAAIDIGTNSVRLLIGDGTTSDVREMRVTRLGRNVDATKRLDPAGIDATLAVLAEYREILDRHDDVASLRVTATSAARDATNRDDFFSPATAIIGVTPELLSGQDEATLSFIGAVTDLDVAQAPFLVVDIGGGSTEFAYGTIVGGQPTVQRTMSIDVGCVRMTERFLESDPPEPGELANCLEVLAMYWDDVRAEMPEAFSNPTFVGLAGTVVNVAAVEIGLEAYDRNATHHFVLTKDAVEDVFRTLATESLQDRIHNPGLEAARADVIVGGLCVLVSIMRQFGFSECLVSENDILDGLIRSQIPG